MGVHSPYYRWFVKDYNSDPRVTAMTDDQDLAYRRMLDASWELGPLPNKLDHLAMIVRYDLERFRRAWSYPLTLCWQRNGQGTLINQRLEDERESMLKRSDKARKAVKKREKNRSKRVMGKKKRPAISRSSSDELPLIHPKPKPYKSTTTTKKQQTSKEQESISTREVLFVRGESAPASHFDGPGVEVAKARVRADYSDEFGDAWLWARWLKAEEWAFDHQKEIESKKDLYLFILGWFRRDAASARERRKDK